jgi:hypothetical protein
MAKKAKLSAALHRASGKTEPEEKVDMPVEPVAVEKVKSSVPPSRQGTKAVTGWFDPAVSRQMKQIALDNDTSIQELLREALNDLFQKHGKSTIA